MINEAQAGNQAISNLKVGVTKEAPDKEMDNKFAMQDEDTAAAASICQGEINDLNVALISNPTSHCEPYHGIPPRS